MAMAIHMDDMTRHDMHDMTRKAFGSTLASIFMAMSMAIYIHGRIHIAMPWPYLPYVYNGHGHMAIAMAL